MANAPTFDEIAPPARLAAWRTLVSWRWLRWPSIWILAVLIVLSILARVLTPYSPVAPDPLNKLLAPSRAHWFGTDPLGMDVFTRILYATRTDLSAALASVVLGMVWGTPLGVIAAYAGGPLDRILTRLAESLQAFPQILFAMA